MKKSTGKKAKRLSKRPRPKAKTAPPPQSESHHSLSTDDCLRQRAPDDLAPVLWIPDQESVD